MRHFLSLVCAGALAASASAQTVYDLEPGSASSSPGEFAALDGATLLFIADADAVPGAEIMRWTQGLGVEFVTQIGVQSFPPTGDPKWVEYMTLTPAWVGGRNLVFFSGNDGETGREPWVTDGTAAGTRLLADIVSSSYSSYPTQFTEAGGRMYFAASADQFNNSLFVSDGTPEGTQNLFANDPLLTMESSSAMTALGDELVFGAKRWSEGWALWKTDGTPGGTLPWLQFPASMPGLLPSGLFAFDGGVAVVGYTPATGHELHFARADGSLSSWNLNPGSGHSLARDFTLHAGELFFTLDDGSHGRELWKLASGTSTPELIADLVPGPTSSGVKVLVSADDGLYFAVEGASTGVGLWRTQGVPGDPVPVPDLTPWPGIVNPIPLAAMGGGILLAADTAGSPRQPYLATSAGIVAVPGWDASITMGTFPWPLARLVDGQLIFRAFTASTGDEIAAFDHDGALSQDLGGTVSGIELETSDALLGQVLDVRIEGVPPSALGGVLALSAPTNVQVLPGFAPQNGAWLDPTGYQIAKLLPAGTTHALTFPIPANPALVGAALHVQAVILDSDYATFLTSNGTRLDLGL